MWHQRSLEANVLAPADTPAHKLLGMFRERHAGFQVPSRGSYREHEHWRNEVFRGLKLLEAEGLLVVQQLVPCERHWRCAGQPVAAGCVLTPLGQRVRGFPGAAS
jgi:hypothetical protein